MDPPQWGPLADSAIRFLGTAQGLTDEELHDASALPGWTRAHVLTHVAQAADSRTRLLRAAQAGRVGQQYPSEEALSNKQIAEHLVITPKTAGNHVEHIYAKIDASSRAAAALFAVQHGLLPEQAMAGAPAGGAGAGRAAR
jgi:hypothetical protein